MSHTFSLNCRESGSISSIFHYFGEGLLVFFVWVGLGGGKGCEGFLLLERQVRGQGRNCQNTHNVA